jgi:hypothetical protein
LKKLNVNNKEYVISYKNNKNKVLRRGSNMTSSSFTPSSTKESKDFSPNSEAGLKKIAENLYNNEYKRITTIDLIPDEALSRSRKEAKDAPAPYQDVEIDGLNLSHLNQHLEKQLLARQGNLIAMSLDGKDHFFQLRMGDEETSPHTPIIEAIKYLRGALVVLESKVIEAKDARDKAQSAYDQAQLNYEKTKNDSIKRQLKSSEIKLKAATKNFKSIESHAKAQISIYLQYYNYLLQQAESKSEKSFAELCNEVKSYYHYLRNSLNLTTKEMTFARDLALQRQKQIAKLTYHQDDPKENAESKLEAKPKQIIVNLSTPSVNKNLVRYHLGGNDPWRWKRNAWIQHVPTREKGWVKNFFERNRQEIIDNGGFVATSARHIPFCPNAMSEMILVCDENMSRQLTNIRISRIERVGIVSPVPHPYFWSKDKEARIRQGVNILRSRINTVLADSIRDHINKYGDFYQAGDQIDFPILYSTALSPILFQGNIGEDNNHRFIQEKEEILSRFKKELSLESLLGKNHPGKLLKRNICNQKKLQLQYQYKENLKNPALNADEKRNLKNTYEEELKIINLESKQIENTQEGFDVVKTWRGGYKSETITYNGIKVNLAFKDVNNALNQQRIISYTRNKDKSHSNDLCRGVAADIGLLLRRSAASTESKNEKDTLEKLQKELLSNNVSLLGKKFGKASLFGPPWNTTTLNGILDKLEKGEYKLSPTTKTTTSSAKAFPHFPAEAQHELAQRIRAAIKLRELNHESILTRLSRGFISTLKEIPIIGNLVAGITDCVINKMVGTLLSPWSWKHALNNVAALFKKGTGHNESLIKSAMEILTLSSQGIVLGFCKSSSDRTTIILSAVDAMIKDPALLKSNLGGDFFEKLFKEMKTLIGQGHYSHVISAIKFKEVGHPYAKQCVAPDMVEKMQILKAFRKALKKPQGSIAPAQSKDFFKNFSKDCAAEEILSHIEKHFPTTHSVDNAKSDKPKESEQENKKKNDSHAKIGLGLATNAMLSHGNEQDSAPPKSPIAHSNPITIPPILPLFNNDNGGTLSAVIVPDNTGTSASSTLGIR